MFSEIRDMKHSGFKIIVVSYFIYTFFFLAYSSENSGSSSIKNG